MQTDSLYSPSWYRVAALCPRLCGETRFHRHVYRGEVWYLILNPTTGRVHRLAPAAHALVCLLDGEREVQQAWEATLEGWGDAAPTQDETLSLLGLLHAAGLLQAELTPDTATLFRRFDDEERQERRRKRNPLAFRVPLFDPDAFLSRWEPVVRPLFSRGGALLWLGLVLAAGFAALRHAPELAAAGGSLLEPESVLALWFSYPVVKTLHELGHAFAVKRWGGEVHEVGILFLVLVPVPFVDASAAAVFPEKHRRMAVGAAGIAVELGLAALAMLVWIAVEPGFVRHVAYATLLVGGVSTLVFNGNPLLRFDGYYVLADALEIPNLASRANQYLGALGRRWLLGLRETPLPETAAGEAFWLVGYGVASFAYGIAVMLGISLYLAGRFFFLGIALALFTLATRIALPLLRRLAFVLTDPAVGERRGRALAGSLGLAVLVGVLVFALPMPLYTMCHGVTWLPEHSHVRAGIDGFVVEMLAEPHAAVKVGQPLLRIRDLPLEASLRELEALRRELEVKTLSLSHAHADRVQAEIARGQLLEREAALARARERASEILVRSPAAGTFVPVDGRDPVGRRVRQGQAVAYVVDLRSATARVVVRQEDVALLRERTLGASVRLAHDLGRVLPGRIARQVPAATDRLPTRALGSAGGGPFAVDPLDPDGLRTLERVFQFELALPEGTIPVAGERVYVRFEHGAEPIGQRGYRALRRLLLSRLGV